MASRLNATAVPSRELRAVSHFSIHVGALCAMATTPSDRAIFTAISDHRRGQAIIIGMLVLHHWRICHAHGLQGRTFLPQYEP
ncbi:hypothetical protein OAO87_03215 [bacterium]|nr:hypothetical protein [bacterium]